MTKNGLIILIISGGFGKTNRRLSGKIGYMKC